MQCEFQGTPPFCRCINGSVRSQYLAPAGNTERQQEPKYVTDQTTAMLTLFNPVQVMLATVGKQPEGKTTLH